MAASWGPMRYSVTMPKTRVLPLSGTWTQAAEAAITLGVAVNLSGKGARRLKGSGFKSLCGTGKDGGHDTAIRLSMPAGVGWRGPSWVTMEVSASRPKLYSSWATRDQVGWRYHASSNTAWWQDLTTPENVSR